MYTLHRRPPFAKNPRKMCMAQPLIVPEGNELGSLYIGKTACQAWVIIPAPWKK